MKVKHAVGGSVRLNPTNGVSGKRRARAWLLVTGGLLLVGGAWAYVVQDCPVLVYGMPTDLGALTKGKVTTIHVQFWNLSPRSATVMTEAPGCTVSGAKYVEARIAPLAPATIDYTIDPSRLKPGATDASVVIHVNVGGRPIRMIRPVRFSVRSE